MHVFLIERYASILQTYYQLYSKTTFNYQKQLAFAIYTLQESLENIEKLPDLSQIQLRAMIQGNWLLHYGHYEGLSYCFLRLTKRVAQPQWLESWHVSLQ